VLKGVVFFIYSIDYLLHVLLVFNLKGIFGKEILTQKCAEMDSFFYI